MNANRETAAPLACPWTLYDFERDGYRVFDEHACDYYLLCFVEGALDSGVVLKATYAGPEGLHSDRDASGAFGLCPVDPRSVAAYVEVRRPEITDDLMVALARAPRKLVFWEKGRHVGEIETRRPREQLAELHGRGFSIKDGTITTYEGDAKDVPEDALWIGATHGVTPVRMDVDVMRSVEVIHAAQADAERRRQDSTSRALKKAQTRSRRANEQRLLVLGTTFDEKPALAELRANHEKLAAFGLIAEFEVYVERIKTLHFARFVIAEADSPEDVPAACEKAQVVFMDKCRQKIRVLVAEIPKLEQREAVRADFEGRMGISLLFSSEVTALLSGDRRTADLIRNKARSVLSPHGNQRLYSREDIERELERARK